MPTLLSLLLFALLSVVGPGVADAQGTTDNAEARVYFEEGNRLYQEAARSRGDRRTTLLQQSLEAYVDSLQIVRSRNALFNAAIVLGELERYDESFNYFTEYLAVEGISETDRTEAQSRRDALRRRVAVLRVTTDPDGATVWIDRKDLAARGETPIELALPEGSHTAYVEKDGYVPIEQAQRLVKGESATVVLSLAPAVTPPPTEPEPLDLPPPPENLRLRNAAIGTAAATLATGATALGLSIKGRNLRDDANAAAAQYRMTGDEADRQRAEDLADRTDRFNIAADVLWATTISLGVTAIVLYAVHQKRKKREAPEVALSVSRRGAYASLSLQLGARP